MAFPTGWPPRAVTGRRSFRFFQQGTTSSDFSDNAWLFGNADSSNEGLPYIAPGSTSPVVIPPTPGGGGIPGDASYGTVPAFVPRFLRISNDGTNDIEVSYDGTNIHGVVLAGEQTTWEYRLECGVAIRSSVGLTSDFRVEAW